LKFVDGTEKTYDASELDFYRLDEDEYGQGGGLDSNTKYKVGDKIKSFEVKKIVDGYAVKYDANGRKTPYVTSYLLLLSDDGQERILRADKKSLSDAEKYTPTFGHKSKFKTWNMLANTSDKMKGGGGIGQNKIKTSKDEDGNSIGKYLDYKFKLFNLSDGWQYSIYYYSPSMEQQETYSSDRDHTSFRTKKSALESIKETIEDIKTRNDNFTKSREQNNDKYEGGGDVRDYEWYQGFKKLSNAPKPAHYTAIADLGTRKIKRHLDNRMEVDEFLNEMSDREVISVELSKFTEQGLTRTVKFDWTGGEWELVSDETVEKKNLKKEG
jgi:hypothetical protein